VLLDTDVMVDVLRNYPPAVAWLNSLGNTAVGLPGLVAMELIQGCPNLAEQQRVQRQIARFVLSWPSEVDCNRALQDFSAFRLSHGVGLLDALIGHTAVGRNEPLATCNIKHFGPMSGLQTIQPY
jgi:predicted nucleic acid-binding protein